MSYNPANNSYTRDYRFESASDAENGDPITQLQHDVSLDDVVVGVDAALKRGMMFASETDLAASTIDYNRFSAGEFLIVGPGMFEVIDAASNTPQVTTAGGLKLIEAGAHFSSTARATLGKSLGAASIAAGGVQYIIAEPGDDVEFTSADGVDWKKVYEFDGAKLKLRYTQAELTNPLVLTVMPKNSDLVDVSIDGVQQYTDQFTVVGNEITFIGGWPGHANQVEVNVWNWTGISVVPDVANNAYLDIYTAARDAQ